MIGDNFIQKYKPGQSLDSPVSSTVFKPGGDESTENQVQLTQASYSTIPLADIPDPSSDIEALILLIESNTIDITSNYDTWLRILFALTDQFGENGREYAHRISCFHPKYNSTDCDKQYTYCLKAGKSGITIRTLFYTAQQHGITVQNNFSYWYDELSIKIPNPYSSSSGTQPFTTEAPIQKSEIRNPQFDLLSFPVDVFPLVISDFISKAAKSINCPSDFIAVPVLTVLATAIGTSCSIQLKRGWVEGPHIFSAVVALPGSKKSPALSTATLPIKEIQRSFSVEHSNQENEYNQQLSSYNIQAEIWKKRKPEDKKPEDQPNPPVEPILKQIKTSNATMEAIGKLLDQNKRGILFEQDELAAWVKSMNAYRGGKGSDLENWLSFWNGSQAIINRASAKKPLILDHPFVNVTGCIQPDLLSDLSGIKQNGFFDRILPSFPNPIPQRYSTDELPEEVAAEYCNIVKVLFDLQPVTDNEGSVTPTLIYFTIPSRQEWEKWNLMHDAEMNSPDLPYYLLGVWSKLQAYMARFILIIQLTNNATEKLLSREVHPETVLAAARLVKYFKSHIRKVYTELFNSEMDRKLVLAVAWIKRNGGSATARMLLSNNVGKCTSSQQVKELLLEMTERNIGTISQTTPKGGGNPTITFTLNNPTTELETI